MSDEEGRQLKKEEILKVHNYIEHCLTIYMTKKETAETLLKEKIIEHRMTEMVWRLMEQENPEFFKAYYTRLAMKEQIETFVRLLEQQTALMGHLESSKLSSGDASTASDDGRKLPPIWRLLEKDNQEFFKEYYAKLAVREEIETINRLREKQAELTDLSMLLKSNT